MSPKVGKIGVMPYKMLPSIDQVREQLPKPWRRGCHVKLNRVWQRDASWGTSTVYCGPCLFGASESDGNCGLYARYGDLTYRPFRFIRWVRDAESHQRWRIVEVWEAAQ